MSADMINRLQEHVAALLFPLSGLGAIMSWQEQLEWGVRVGAGVVAIAAGIASIMYYRNKSHNRTAGKD